MKRVYVGICILFLGSFLIGCADTESDESPNEEVSEAIDMYDFYFINRAPATTEKHPLDELIKIYFSTKNVAIDLENEVIIEKPRFATNGVATFEDPLPFTDQEGLLKILDKYHVQDWKEDYTTEDPDTYDDGYGWMMLLQFEDGTIERYKGAGTEKETVFAETFAAFAKAIETFKNEKVKEATE